MPTNPLPRRRFPLEGRHRVIPGPRHATRSRVKRALGPALVFAAALSCASAGPYGYSRSYEPLDEEEDAAAGARAYDPVMASRSPARWKDVKISVYGVVTARREGPGGTTHVTLSLRTLEPRNLCESRDDSSCRVTVSEREHGVVHAHLALRPEDALGAQSVNPGSLVRVIGKISDQVDENDGGHTLKAVYYRHWPRNYYVTTAARSFMRQ